MKICTTKSKLNFSIINSLFMKLFPIVLLILLLVGCGQGPASGEQPKDAAQEQPMGVQENFDDTPGLIRSEIFDASGRLATVGYWLDGKKAGSWTDYTEDDRVHRLTNYIGGKKEGVYLEFNTANQLMVRCFYHNDKRHGKYVEYIQTRVKEERYYSFGKLEGISRVYFPNGNLMEEGYYKNGLREGVSKWYDRDGNKTLEYLYEKGELVKN